MSEFSRFVNDILLDSQTRSDIESDLITGRSAVDLMTDSHRGRMRAAQCNATRRNDTESVGLGPLQCSAASVLITPSRRLSDERFEH